ncbi:MAG: hypothetical protein KC501_21410 [Myxococcales bacterium]|nr:hypothetical protein [Myxococcales bacterium]
MLSFDRPLGVVADLVLHRDHADPTLVHYLPARPRIVHAAEGPALSLVKLRGVDLVERDGAGLLTFTTELRADEEQLEAARRALQEQGLVEPKLVPVLAHRAKATVAAALQEGDGFVEKMFGEVPADPLGHGRASFSVLLGEAGARLVETALALGGAAGLGVRYELEVVGLRPALDARLKADYGRVYDELAAELSVGLATDRVGLQAGLDSTTKRLVEEGAIELEVLHFSDDADLRAKIDQTLRWFQDEIVRTFFRSRLPAEGEDLLSRAMAAASGMGTTLASAVANSDQATQLAQQLGISVDRLRALAASAGTPAALEVGLSLREIHQEERRVVELDWSETRPERRTIRPQGMLGDLGLRPDDARIVEVDPRDELWAKLDVDVAPAGDLAALGVERLIVRVAFPAEDDPGATMQDFAFSPDQLEPRHFAAWTNGRPREYRTQSEVLFAAQGPWPGPPSFTGAWRSTRFPSLVVHPLAEVPRLELELGPGTVSFDDTPRVQVELRIDGEDVANEMLAADSPSAVVRRRLAAVPSAEPTEEADDAGPRVEARCTWLHADGGRSEGEWTPVTGSMLLVGSPWRSHRTIRVLPVLAPGFIDASVTLTLLDGDVPRVTTVSFAPGERGAKVVSLPSLAEEPPPVQVEVVVVGADGDAYFGDPYETTEAVVVLRDREGEQRKVEVRLVAGATLASHGVIAVQVQQVDRSGQPLDSILFTESRRDPAALYVAVDDGETTLRYRVVRYGADGQAHATEVLEAEGERLLVPAMIPPGS